MASVFVVTSGTAFLSWDDKGAMSTGYPMWVSLDQARQYSTIKIAEKQAEAAFSSSPTGKVFIQEVRLVLGDRAEFVPPEADPEWETYTRLKQKFNNR